MIPQQTGIKILKKFAPMTGSEEKIQIELSQMWKSQEHGGMKIKEDLSPIALFLEPSVMEVYFDYPASGVEKKNHLLTTMITTNLLKSCGFANLATNKGTKNWVQNSDKEIPK